MLNKITIKGYRSIKEASIELGSLNVLIGANGSGKSNLVSFFRMLNEMMANRLQAYIGSTGRAQSFLHFGPKVTPEMEATLEFLEEERTDIYRMRLSYSAGDTLVFVDERLRYVRKLDGQWKRLLLGAGHQETNILEDLHRAKPTAVVFRRLLTQCRVFHFDDTSQTAAIRQFCYINDNKELMPDAGNLAAMLYAYRLTHDIVYRRIISTIQKIMPDFDNFDLEPSRLNSNEIILNWRKKGRGYLFGPHQISDGTLRAMAILTLFLQPESDLPKVIILDEPELGLHPQALELVAGVMRSVSDKAQVIVATQSQSFLNNFDPAEIITVESNQSETSFHRLKPEELEVWLEDYSLGGLWQRDVLGGGLRDDKSHLLANHPVAEIPQRKSPMPDCKANSGNLMQHWTLCESLNALRGATQKTNPLLLYIDAHAMMPFSHFGAEDGDARFHRVRAHLPGQCSLYEKTWRKLVPVADMLYPSSAAFVDQVWDGRRAYLLCEQNEERAAACTQWMQQLEAKGQTSCFQVFAGEWQDRFERHQQFPLSRLAQARNAPRMVEPDAVFVSFDPNMISCRRRPTRPDKFNLYPEDFDLIWGALAPFAGLPTVLQVSTYSTQDSNSQTEVERSVANSRPAGWCGPVTVRVNQSMMSLLFWTPAKDVGLDGLPRRFAAWLEQID